MPKRRLAAVTASLVLVALALAGVSFRAVSPARALTNCDTAEDGITTSEQQMLDLINQARAQAGIGSLKFSAALNRAAAWKSADSGSNGLGTGFSHTDSLGRLPTARARDCGYPYGAAENVAYGSTSAETIFGMWMNSPGHRANILMASYRVIGIGQHLSAWTTDFGNVDDSGVATSSPKTATPTPSPAPTATPTPRHLVGISMQLAAGMNLVTYAGSVQPVAGALASLGGAVTGVYEWDQASGRWQRYSPDGPAYANTFNQFKPGGVYYIELSSGGTWAY